MRIWSSRLLWRKLGFVFGLLTLIGLSVSPAVASAAATPSNLYVDPILQFSLRVPSGWQVKPGTVAHPSVSRSFISFADPALPTARIDIAVMRGSQMPADFAKRGTAPSHVGQYPAFDEDTAASAQVPEPCTGRVFLAQTDWVIAHMCADMPQGETASFLGMLATYQPIAPSGAKTTAPIIAMAASAPSSCSTLAANASSKPSDQSNWGRQLASAYDSRWGVFQSQGANVCSNWIKTSPTTGYDWSGYYFQCVELANRFDREQWGLAGFDVDAGQYYDYYQNGTLNQGRVRTLFPSSAYQLVSDSSQSGSPYGERPRSSRILETS